MTTTNEIGRTDPAEIVPADSRGASSSSLSDLAAGTPSGDPRAAAPAHQPTFARPALNSADSETKGMAPVTAGPVSDLFDDIKAGPFAPVTERKSA